MNIQYINDLESEELKKFTKLSENQLKHYYEPKVGLFMAESPVVIERALAAGYEPETVLTDEKHIDEIKELFERTQYSDVDVYVIKEEMLKQLRGFEMTRGALCTVRRKEVPTVEELLANNDFKRVAVLEEVINPTNVGAIFRSAAALGVDAVILTFGCADPLYKRSVRVSMGNVFLVPWAPAGPKDNVISILKSHGYITLAMALREDTVSIDKPVLKEHDKLAIILGTESEGLKEETIAACDYTVKIPMADGVDSLNVAAASAVAFWEMRTN